MSKTYIINFIKKDLLEKGKYRDRSKTYFLVNNWEGTYFDFNEDKKSFQWLKQQKN